MCSVPVLDIEISIQGKNTHVWMQLFRLFGCSVEKTGWQTLGAKDRSAMN